MQNRSSLAKSLSLFTAAPLIMFGASSWAQSTSAPVFKRQAGSWMVNITIEKVEGADAPQGTKELMQSMFDKQSETQLCLTQAAAAQEDFVGNMLNSANKNNCKMITENVTDKTINIVAACPGPDGKDFTISMEGDYSPTVTNMIMKSENAPGKTGPITMHMRTSAKWVGKCTQGQAELY